MLRFPLIHPPLLAALGAAGHGGQILLADANYSHSTNVSPGAALIHLNLRPGLVTVDQVLEPLLSAVPIEAATVMRPDDGSTPAVFDSYRRLLGEDLPLRPLGRLEFYAECRQPDWPSASRPATSACTPTCCSRSGTSRPAGREKCHQRGAMAPTLA